MAHMEGPFRHLILSLHGYRRRTGCRHGAATLSYLWACHCLRPTTSQRKVCRSAFFSRSIRTISRYFEHFHSAGQLLFERPRRVILGGNEIPRTLVEMGMMNKDRSTRRGPLARWRVQRIRSVRDVQPQLHVGGSANGGTCGAPTGPFGTITLKDANDPGGTGNANFIDITVTLTGAYATGLLERVYLNYGGTLTAGYDLEGDNINDTDTDFQSNHNGPGVWLSLDTEINPLGHSNDSVVGHLEVSTWLLEHLPEP